MLQGNQQFAAKTNILEFENKILIQALKNSKQKRNRDKLQNFLRKKDNSLQLFLLLHIYATQEFAIQKKIEKE